MTAQNFAAGLFLNGRPWYNEKNSGTPWHSECGPEIDDGIGILAVARRTTNDTFAGVPNSHPLPVVFFRTAAGSEPVREWLKKLPSAERFIIGEDLKTLQFRWPLGMPLVRSLGNGLWELRSNLPTRIARCIFYLPRGRIVVLHGFIKKTQKTPPEDKALALKRKDAHCKAEENQEPA